MPSTLLLSPGPSRGPSSSGRHARGALLALVAGSCAREPAERLCPEAAAGALVVSELSAAPRGGDPPSPSWIELFNASGDELDLLGVGVRMRRLDGGAEQRLLVRRSLVAPAGEAVVLSQSAEGQEPAFASYGFAADAPGAFYAAAVVTVESCEAELDRLTYARLPAAGSLSLGAWPPSAEANDLAGAWCADAQGSPARRNQPCR
jgi:hypothetical protein